MDALGADLDSIVFVGDGRLTRGFRKVEIPTQERVLSKFRENQFRRLFLNLHEKMKTVRRILLVLSIFAVFTTT